MDEANFLMEVDTSRKSVRRRFSGSTFSPKFRRTSSTMSRSSMDSKVSESTIISIPISMPGTPYNRKRREDLWNSLETDIKQDKSSHQSEDYKRHQQSLRKLAPTFMKPPDLGEKYWTPKNKKSVQNWLSSYETELQSFRSHDMLAQVKLTEVMTITQCTESPNRMLSTLVTQIMVDMIPRWTEVAQAASPAMICCLQSAFSGLQQQNFDMFAHTVETALTQATNPETDVTDNRPATAQTYRSPTRRVSAMARSTQMVSPTGKLSPSRARIKYRRRPWSSPARGTSRRPSSARAGNLGENIRPMSSHSSKLRFLRKANANTRGYDSMIRTRWQQELTATELFFTQVRALEVAEVRGRHFQRRYKIELAALKQRLYLEKKNLNGMAKRFGSSLKRIIFHEWKTFVVRKKSARYFSTFMGNASKESLLSTYFVLWKRKYGAARLRRQQQIHSKRRVQVIKSKRQLDAARDRLRKLKVAISDQSHEAESMKDDLSNKTQTLNHPAQNVQLLSHIIDVCKDALSVVTELLAEDFPRMSNELQGSERESGSFLLFDQDDPHLNAYMRKSEGNVMREWKNKLELWPEYFPKGDSVWNVVPTTTSIHSDFKLQSLSYQSDVDVVKMVTEYDQLRRSEADPSSKTTEDTWDAWTEASGKTLQLWIQHKLWDPHAHRSVADYNPDVLHRIALSDWRMQGALLHRVIPPTLVQHATSDEDVLLRQRRILAEVQTLAPPIGRYISLCDPSTCPPEHHHWVHRAAVLHAYTSNVTEYDIHVEDKVFRDVHGEPHGIEYIQEVALPVYFAFLSELYCCHPGFTTQLSHAINMWNRMAIGIKQSKTYTKIMVGKVSTVERKSVQVAHEIAKLNKDVRRIAMYFIINYTQWVRERYLWYVSCTNLIQASWHNASVLLYSKPHLGEPDDQSVRPPPTPRSKTAMVKASTAEIQLNKAILYDFLITNGVTDIKERLREYEAVLTVLTQHQNLLARVFSFYVALTPHGETWCLSYTAYMRLLDDCKLIGDTKRKHGLISNIFVKQLLPIPSSASDVQQARKYINQSEITFEQCLLAITMTAHEFYKVGKNDIDRGKSTLGRTAGRLDSVIRRFIIRHATMLRVQQFQFTVRRDLGAQKVLRDNMPVINAIFIWFSLTEGDGVDKTQDVLDYSAFERILTEAQMFLPFKFSRRMARSLFVCSVKASGFASLSPSARLWFPEFVDCLVAVAQTFYPNPYQVLSRKIEALLMKQLYLGLSEVERYRAPMRAQLEKAGLLDKFQQMRKQFAL